MDLLIRVEKFVFALLKIYYHLMEIRAIVVLCMPLATDQAVLLAIMDFPIQHHKLAYVNLQKFYQLMVTLVMPVQISQLAMDQFR